MANNALSFYLIFELTKRAGLVFFSMVNYVVTLTGMGLEFGFLATRTAFGSGRRLS